MQDWNKVFYQSKAWQDCRLGYLTAKHFICERCGDIAKIAHHKTPITPVNIHDPCITLAYENLEALCQTCHNVEHHKTTAEAARYSFDSAGNLIQPPHPDTGQPPPQTEAAP